MAKPHIRDPRRERRWRTLLTQWTRSGLSVRDFCRRHHLPETAFYHWRRAIAARDRSSPPAPSTPARTSAPTQPRRSTPRPTFAPVRVVPDQPLELVLRTGHVLRIPPGSDPAYLATLVAAVETDRC